MTGSETELQTRCALLVDYDNFFAGELATAEEIRLHLDRMVRLALTVSLEYREIRIRFYGGWLEEGLLTSRGSELQAAIGIDYFPVRHPEGGGLLRGSVSLVTRLAAVPQVEWSHTLRTRRGIPRLRIADGPRPNGCGAPDNCPIDLVQRISRRLGRECHIDGCSVTNGEAFRLREQKMVDSMICCDSLALVAEGLDIFVLSDDLDVLPAVAMAAVQHRRRVVLVRSSSDSDRLYDTQLAGLGVSAEVWEAA